MLIDDEILKQELGSNGDVQLKNALLEQYKKNKMRLSGTPRIKY